ncbi:uncharacterized protein LOC112568091 isoform X2 [Pomacea canaliculata]|uniref:uncharacterized protein LOC112568091 isoform X2 n=1 Tax=Pomacea canaliculata TaxID=400727 RepID=UPI000D72B589|nr:uncharacterized protein LOC112568091 isoform X2 [Pomacea canaliculata]
MTLMTWRRPSTTCHRRRAEGRCTSSLMKIKNFQTLYEKLLTRVPRLHLWAASYFHQNAPAGWQVEYLTRPLRSPPTVVREVEQDEMITTDRHVLRYSERGVPDHTDGPPVRRLYHRGHSDSGRFPEDCVTCGREVASFLQSLRVGVTENSTTTSTALTSTNGATTPPCIQWRDVLVLSLGNFTVKSGMVTGLQEAGIPVQIMEDDYIEDLATARSDVVWMTRGHYIRGLERKVVVCIVERDLQDLKVERMHPLHIRLNLMSRCTSQLVLIYPDRLTPEGD